MEKRVKIRKTVFGGAIARICCLALCLCLGLSISMTAQAASGKKVTPVTMAAVVGEEKTVTQQADKTSAALGILPAGTTVNVCGQTGSGKSGMYQIVYGNAIGYITQTACQPVCVDAAMTAALAAQAEAVKQQVAQAQAAAAALAAQPGTVLFAKNEDQPYYPASITKILTALIVLEHCSLDEEVTFSHDDVYNVEAGSSTAGGTGSGAG